MIGRALRAIVLVALYLATAGFGVCGIAGTLLGTVSVASDSPDQYGIGRTALTWGLAGMAIAALCLWGYKKLARKPEGE